MLVENSKKNYLNENNKYILMSSELGRNFNINKKAKNWLKDN